MLPRNATLLHRKPLRISSKCCLHSIIATMLTAPLTRWTLVVSGLLCHASFVHAQGKPIFPGAERLDSCTVDLPLTYRKKDEVRYMAAATALKEQELIYLRYHRKRKRATLQRVYVVAKHTNDGREYVFLEGTDSHHRVGTTTEVIFPAYRKKNERFYTAACFDAKLAANPDLRTVIFIPEQEKK